MRRVLSSFSIIILLSIYVTLGGFAQAAEPQEPTADNFSEVRAQAMQLGELFGNEKVLLVFDIDNTLLAMRQELGSDQWFAWQLSLPETNPQRIGNFSQLLRAQGLLYSVSSMRPTHVEQPQIVEQLQQAGFITLLLTSRGFDNRDATRRELVANGYDFRNSTLTPREGFAGVYCPYDAAHIEQSGITREEAERWLAVEGSNPVEIKQPRPVSYNDGVYMTAGQNKGVMLRMLLCKSGNIGKFNAIVYVDDQPKHTQNVREAFGSMKNEIKVVTLRYSREDADVRRFEENKGGEQQRAAAAWKQLEHTLNVTTYSTLNIPQEPPKCVSTAK